MSKLEELLQEVNVEWKILSEISNIGLYLRINLRTQQKNER